MWMFTVSGLSLSTPNRRPPRAATASDCCQTFFSSLSSLSPYSCRARPGSLERCLARFGAAVRFLATNGLAIRQRGLSEAKGQRSGGSQAARKCETQWAGGGRIGRLFGCRQSERRSLGFWMLVLQLAYPLRTTPKVCKVPFSSGEMRPMQVCEDDGCQELEECLLFFLEVAQTLPLSAHPSCKRSIGWGPRCRAGPRLSLYLPWTLDRLGKKSTNRLPYCCVRQCLHLHRRSNISHSQSYCT
jgi:hypothetical protein